MNKLVIRILVLLLCGVMVLGLVMPALATVVDASEVTGEHDSAFKRIRTVEDLLAMAEDPDGSYVLMNDIDMTGVEWKPVDFTGTFDGNGYALLNLSITQLGDEKATAYDGNRKPYECSFAGFFGTLKDAEVMGLKLVGVDGMVVTDEPVFVGGIAGYCWNSTVTNCTVVGNMELRAHNQIFGLGGILGYGLGAVTNCEVDVVLICTDTDKETKDEQFLGGVYSTGYIDVTDTNVKITGCISDYGYVHSGGIVGMYMQYPIGEGKRGYIQRNYVEGSITFFECNNDRRAYCAPFAGEVLAVSYNLSENMQRFQRKELWTYDKEVRPCMCEEPKIDEYALPGKCAKYGHTETECLNCAFIKKHKYTPFEHIVLEWTLVEEPTLRTEGLSQGTCAKCGIQLERKEPVLEPEPEPSTKPTMPEPVGPTVPQNDGQMDAVQSKISVLFLVLAIASVLLVALAGFLAYDIRKQKKNG